MWRLPLIVRWARLRLPPVLTLTLSAIMPSQEQSLGIHYNVGKSVLDYVANQEDFQFADGFIQLPSLPGLGVKVNKELVVGENKHPHAWKNPVWRHQDGSVAEW